MDLTESINNELTSSLSKNVFTPDFTLENIDLSSANEAHKSSGFKCNDTNQSIIQCDQIIDPDVTQLDISNEGQLLVSNRQFQSMRKRHLIIQNGDDIDISTIYDTMHL